MKKLRPYISIHTDEKDRVSLVVEDYELFDFIDDYLCDSFDFYYEFRTSKERAGGEIITMYFPELVKEMEVETAILQLSETVIEEIYLLNNEKL